MQEVFREDLLARGSVCAFRAIVTDRFGNVTAEFGSMTDHFGDVVGGVFATA